jgi:ABC-2 type transport system permease protein
VIQQASLTWLAGHELRLGWRDWVSLMTAGGRTRGRTAFVALVCIAIFMHVFAYWTVAAYADAGLGSDTAALVGITGTLILSWSLLLSQAMESVTRAFYSRSDLDLILTSPASARKVFAVRMGRIAMAAGAIAVLLAAPFINVLAALGGGRWLAAYGVVIAMGAVATAVALALTITLFRTIGAKRTRLVAQIVAAVIGAAFVIGLQVAAIFSAGSLSRYAALQSDWMLRHAPDTASAFWWPARAVLGDYVALAAVFGFAAAVLGMAIAVFSHRFGEHSIAAAGVSNTVVQQRRWVLAFRRRSPARTLRHKEWTLLKRDPWLVSQTLMQILYLLPPALLLWVTFRTGHDAFIVLIPVIVMAAGQLAGGLAWLTISGEDAPDLVSTAPIAANRILLAKIEAVIGMVALIFAPIVALLAFDAVFAAAVCGLGILSAAAAATMIQLCFRVQARRSHFRRRQTSSRIATFAEAFSSIAWAATSALAAAGVWQAIGPAIVAFGILAVSGCSARHGAELRIGNAQPLTADEYADQNQIENIGTDSGCESRRIVAEVIIEQSREPAAERHATAAE